MNLEIFQDLVISVQVKIGMIDTTKICDVEIDGIDTRDYPKFCDAFILSANWLDGTPLNDEELDELSEDQEFVHQKVWDFLF